MTNKKRKPGEAIDLFLDEAEVRETFEQGDRIRKRKKWGPWRVIDTKTYRFLVFPLPSGEYSVPLCELKTAKGLREWLEHLHEKTWATPETLGWLVKAIFSIEDMPAPAQKIS